MSTIITEKDLFNKNRNNLVPVIIFIGVIIMILHQLAISLELYWTLDWSDIAPHFLGGALIGLVSVFYASGLLKECHFHNKIILLWIVISSVISVGSLWEIWELSAGLIYFPTDFLDSVIDLVMDFMSALVAYFYGMNKIWKQIN